jgi:hypothetical protein
MTVQSTTASDLAQCEKLEPEIQPESLTSNSTTAISEKAKYQLYDAEEAAPTTATDEPEWVTGWRLAVIMGAVTLACFLMMLDNTILSTVRLVLDSWVRHRSKSILN